MEFSKLPDKYKRYYFENFGRQLNAFDKISIDHRIKVYDKLFGDESKRLNGFTNLCESFKYAENPLKEVEITICKLHDKINQDIRSVFINLNKSDLSDKLYKYSRAQAWLRKHPELSENLNNHLYIALDVGDLWFDYLKANGVIDCSLSEYLASKVNEDEIGAIDLINTIDHVKFEQGYWYSFPIMLLSEILASKIIDADIAYCGKYLLIDITVNEFKDDTETFGIMTLGECDIQQEYFEKCISLSELENYTYELGIRKDTRSIIDNIKNLSKSAFKTDIDNKRISIINPVTFKMSEITSNENNLLINRILGEGNKFNIEFNCKDPVEFQYIQGLLGIDTYLSDMVTYIKGMQVMLMDIPNFDKLLNSKIINIFD